MLERYIGRQIEKKAFPGISILVASGADVLYERCFGSCASEPREEPLHPGTLYDLASLTKPLVTAFLAAWFIERKQWRLEDAPRRFLSGFPLAITVEQLLTHSAGLRPWHPFYLYRPQDDLKQMILAVDALPGERVLYSDVGYILLRHLLEKTSGCRLPELAAAVIFKPLGLRDTFLSVPVAARGRCAPTETGNRFERALAAAEHGAAAAGFPWRTEVIRGEVHDANSFYAGGCAGNAGLFASARDLFRLGQEFFPASATLLQPETLACFWRNRTPWGDQGRTIGFQVNTARASGGRALAPAAIGHTGFTGTSLWLEAEGERQWILLTNRVHPRARRTNFNIVRRQLHRLLKLELGLA